MVMLDFYTGSKWIGKPYFNAAGVFVAVLLTLCSCSSNQPAKVYSESEKKELRIQWTKDYIFCMCLKYSYGDSIYNQISKIDMSAPMLMDIANIYGNFRLLDKAAKEFVDSIPKTQIEDYGEKKPYISRCLDYRESQALDDYIRSMYSEGNWEL